MFSQILPVHLMNQKLIEKLIETLYRRKFANFANCIL